MERSETVCYMTIQQHPFFSFSSLTGGSGSRVVSVRFGDVPGAGRTSAREGARDLGLCGIVGVSL
jgi:hypothetical protein